MPDKKTGEVSHRHFINMEETSADSQLMTRMSVQHDWGPLSLLPGHWRGRGMGWNMIALPFQGAQPPAGNRFRVLMNQYDEDLDFIFVDDSVPNRGLLAPGQTGDFDQRSVAMDYQQVVRQLAADDFPASGIAGGPGMAIHHEPGLFLHMKNLQTDGIDIARLASVPHGNSAISMGKSEVVEGMPQIAQVNGLPIGRFEDLLSGDYDFETDPYLAPYKHFIDNPFTGTLSLSLDFPGFSPVNMNTLLNLANNGVDIERTTVLSFDTEVQDGGVSSIPFVVKQAEPVSMRSTFWIQELAGTDEKGRKRLRMQYSQVVMLNFFAPREDQLPGRATWPHVSINTLEKVFEDDEGELHEKLT